VKPTKGKRLILPAALAVSIAGGALAGCGADRPKPAVDASHGDGKPDTPII